MWKRLFLGIVHEISALGSLPAYALVMVLSFLLIGFSDFFSLLVWLVCSFFFAALIRMLFFKTRPENEGKKKPKGFLERIDASSFPSVHASRAGILAMYLYQINSGWMGIMVATAFFLGVASSRIILKRHDLIDVIGGGIMGILIVLLF